LESYGTGNCPNHLEFLAAIKEAVDRGVIIVNITQCAKGIVMGEYETGVALSETGVIPGWDMTTEAAMTKLAWLLGQNFPKDKIRKKLMDPMRGELSLPHHMYSMTDTKIVDAFITALGLGQSGQEANLAVNEGFSSAMFPILMCLAAGQGNVVQLQQLLKHTNIIGVADYDCRTPLHLAASEGRYEAVKLLVERGADVNARDRWGGTPLEDAIRQGHEKIVKFLEEKGSKLRKSGVSQDTNASSKQS